MDTSDAGILEAAETFMRRGSIGMADAIAQAAEFGRQIRDAQRKTGEATERERCARQLEVLARFERGNESTRTGWVNVSEYRAQGLEWGAAALRAPAESPR